MKFKVQGGKPLRGTIPISGSKNAAIKMVAASLLTSEEVVLENAPHIGDIATEIEIARTLGAEVSWKNSALHLRAKNLDSSYISPSLSSKTRAALVFVGPLLARRGRAVVGAPGGCKISTRPLNRHIQALEALGVKFEKGREELRFETERLQGGTIRFEKNTVMGTENAVLSSVLASGETKIFGAAEEPEVDDLIQLLLKMGAKIKREERKLEIEGVHELHGARHRILSDRNEAVTFAVAGAATRGNVSLTSVRPQDLTSFLAKLSEVGVNYEVSKDTLRVWAEPGTVFNSLGLETAPHPGFMTDWQPPFAVLLTQAEGESLIHETIFLNRFGYVAELQKMGAEIKLVCPSEAGFAPKVGDDSYDLGKKGEPLTVAKIKGPTPLRGAKVRVPDLRAGAALVLAALAAEGTSIIEGAEHIERGYENFVQKLQNLGAKIELVD